MQHEFSLAEDGVVVILSKGSPWNERFMMLFNLCRQRAKSNDNWKGQSFPIHVSTIRARRLGFVWENVKFLSKKIYVGNLSFDVTEEQVKELFIQFGKVESIAMINDRDSGRFRGFCFVELEASAANAAIKALNGQSIDGRELRVNEAKPREERSGGDYRGGNNRRRNSRW